MVFGECFRMIEAVLAVELLLVLIFMVLAKAKGIPLALYGVRKEMLTASVFWRAAISYNPR